MENYLSKRVINPLYRTKHIPAGKLDIIVAYDLEEGRIDKDETK